MFVPIVVWEGEVGQLLRDVAVAIAFAVGSSFVVSVFVIPSLSAKLLRSGVREPARETLDVMYFPSVFSWFPVLGSMKVAVAFHDTIAERYAKIVFPTWKTRTFWKMKVKWALQQSDGIVTVSDWSKRSLADWFKLPPERIFVTPEAPAAGFRPAEDAEPRRRWLRTRGLDPDAPYLIYVGGFNPHKNLGNLIEAFAATSKAEGGAGLGLILVGDFAGDTFHGEVQALRARIAASGLQDRGALRGVRRGFRAASSLCGRCRPRHSLAGGRVRPAGRGGRRVRDPVHRDVQQPVAGSAGGGRPVRRSFKNRRS